MKTIALYSGEFSIAGKKVKKRLDEFKFDYNIIDEKDVSKNKGLSKYKLIIFPGGHHVKVGKKGDKNVKEYVRNGGNFLGICAGMHYGCDLKLLDTDIMYMRGSGYYQIRLLKKHPLTEGYELAPKSPLIHKTWSPVEFSTKGRVHTRRGNGGLIIPGKNVDVIATYDDSDKYAAIVSGEFEKGKVVLISPHPESSEEPDKNDKGQGSNALNLFVNTINYLTK
jgi:glutamine amidotransferase-like uncharacterized protein